MRVLAADTSTPYCSVAVCECVDDQRHVIAETTVRAGRRHSEILLHLVEDLLKYAAIGLNDIDLLAISHGPGSFTGLRVGVATWKGLAFGLRKPLVGVPTLAALARRVGVADRVVCAILDARMQEVFAAAYQLTNGIPDTVMAETVDAIERVLDRLPRGAVVLGDGVLRYRAAVEAHANAFTVPAAEFHHPSAACVAFEGYRRVAAGDPGDAAAVAPLYLRKSQAEALRAASEAAAS